MSIKPSLLLVLLLGVFASAFAADREPDSGSRPSRASARGVPRPDRTAAASTTAHVMPAQRGGTSGVHYASPNAEALRSALSPVIRRASGAPISRTHSGSSVALALARGVVTPARGPLITRRVPGEISAAHPSALRTLGGSTSGKSAIRAAIDGNTPRGRPR